MPALLPPALNPNLFVYPYDAELSALLAPHLNEKPFKIRLGALQLTHDLLTPVLAGEARKHAFEHAIKALLPDAQQDAARFYLEKITDLSLRVPLTAEKLSDKWEAPGDYLEELKLACMQIYNLLSQKTANPKVNIALEPLLHLGDRHTSNNTLNTLNTLNTVNTLKGRDALIKLLQQHHNIKLTR